MGAEFSLFPPPPPPSPRRSRRRRKLMRIHNIHPSLVEYSDEDTIANTIANRSPTPVSKHIALARLAERLSRMGKSRRDKVINMLSIPNDMLRQVRRYTPNNSFGRDDDWVEAVNQDSENTENEQLENINIEEDRLNNGSDIESEKADSDACESPRSTRRAVSFAKYAELRVFTN